MTIPITNKHCQPCEEGSAQLTGEMIQSYLAELTQPWQVIDEKKIRRLFKFKDFKEAMIFVNRVADLAEAEGHHPDIAIHWNQVDIELWTHAINGLSENDFILAAKIEKLI